MRTRFVRLSLLMFSLALSTVACRTTEYPDPSPEIKRLEDAQAAARQDNVDVLSPNFFKDSEENLEDAKKQHNNGSDPASKLSQAQADLDKAIETAKPARVALQDTLAARQKALAANAPDHLDKEWDQIEAKFHKATDDVGRGDLREITRNKEELATLYDNAEVDAIVVANLGAAKENVARAEKDGAKRFAPNTYKETMSLLENKEQGIRADRYNTQFNAEAQQQATAAGERLVRITSESERTGSEQLALEMESKEQQVAATQRQAAEAQRQASEALASQQEATASATAEAAALSERLASDKALEERYRRARSMFSQSEAEVYKDGPNLIVRLKGLNFKTGKSDLASANSELIRKVADVAALFGTPAIKIEGHTDATGSQSTNIRLSDARAKSVKEALSQNMNISEVRISSEGFGDSKPLASNKTNTGRSQNRRVDVIIMPEGEMVSH